MKTAINEGILQSDIDFSNKKPILADLSAYAGANMSWNATTKKFDAAAASGGGGGVPGVFVNVKDEPFNAVGDGVADDTDAINYAMGYVVGLGGGTVFFPHGVYLCNGAFHTYWKSILVIPWVTNTTDSPLVLELLGENTATWTVVGAAQDFANMSTIATTRTDGMTASPEGFAAIIAGNQPRGNDRRSDYETMNAIFVRIRRMTFYCPDNPTMGAIRLDGHGWASVDETLVTCGGSEPTHGTTGIWMPNTINWSTSWIDKCNAQSFAFGYKLSEHTTAPWLQAWACKVGIAFLESMYPSRVGLLYGNCADTVKFLGYHTTDLYMEGEHAFGSAPAWQWSLHEVSDPGNKGMGIIRYHIGHGNNDQPAVQIAMDGGNGLTTVNLVNGYTEMNTTQGTSGGGGNIGRLKGRFYASELLVGYIDAGLAWDSSSVIKVTNGGAGLGSLKASTFYIGTDARLVPVTGGAKLQVRNASTGVWADAGLWTNP